MKEESKEEEKEEKGEQVPISTAPKEEEKATSDAKDAKDQPAADATA